MKELIHRQLTLIKPFVMIIVSCGIVIILSARGITDENILSPQGDMPRYLMNGAFFHDLVKDMKILKPFEYAYLYFAQYPGF